jgi:hypothetical protein
MKRSAMRWPPPVAPPPTARPRRPARRRCQGLPPADRERARLGLLKAGKGASPSATEQRRALPRHLHQRQGRSAAAASRPCRRSSYIKIDYRRVLPIVGAGQARAWSGSTRPGPPGRGCRFRYELGMLYEVFCSTASGARDASSAAAGAGRRPSPPCRSTCTPPARRAAAALALLEHVGARRRHKAEQLRIDLALRSKLREAQQARVWPKLSASCIAAGTPSRKPISIRSNGESLARGVAVSHSRPSRVPPSRHDEVAFRTRCRRTGSTPARRQRRGSFFTVTWFRSLSNRNSCSPSARRRRPAKPARTGFAIDPAELARPLEVLVERAARRRRRRCAGSGRAVTCCK